MGLESNTIALASPKKVAIKAPVLTTLNAEEKKKNATFEKEMRALCEEWAAKSGEPFDMLIAKQGKILFHGAFGENLRGKFTLEVPTEIASITKLYTGLLFAQFVLEQQQYQAIT